MSETERRITLVLDDAVYQMVEEMVRTTGTSKGKVIGKALYLYQYAVDTWANGGAVLLEENGTKREVIRG